jgi:CheY-like chemotaxis protein
MGLGLTLVKSLVQLHGGRVSAKSGGTGKGSEFTVRLPLVPESERELGAEACPSTPRVVTKRVVVVDDSEDVRTMVTELLEGFGFDVTTAVSGPTGLAHIVESRPDVAFVDIGLPGFDGYELARRVRSDLGSGVVLIAMTGYGRAEDRERAFDSGFDRHLTKPVSARDLVAAMSNVSPLA